VFHRLREEVFEGEGLRVRVIGVPYSPNRTLDDLLGIQKKKGDTHLIAVVHALAAKKPPSSVEDFWNETVFPYEALANRSGPDAWCFPPGTPVLDWLYRPIPIESVGGSLAVLSRNGPTGVESVHPPRLVAEELVHLDVEGVPLSLGATREHPYWVAKGLKCRYPSRSDRRCHPDKPNTSYPCSTCFGAPSVAASWVKAEEIESGDYVAIPVPQVPAGTSSCPGLARLLGYYAAEGHLVTNREKDPVAGVAWSFHEDEVDLQEDVRALVGEFFGLETHKRPVSGACVQVCAYGREISEFFAEHGGRYSEHKSLSSWIWQSPPVDRLEFLIGWLLGDGHARAEKTETMGATVSTALSSQIFFLSLSLGLRPYYTIRPESVRRFTKSDGSLHESPGLPCHVISFYGDDGETLARRMGVSPPDRSKTKVAGFFLGGLYYARVRKTWRTYYEGPVHNFRTSTGEYVAGGLLVHNCFGHWHKDQGIELVNGKVFVNHGAVSRGALVRDNLERVPKVSIIEITEGGVLRVVSIPLTVAPAAEVFDLERKAVQEKERHDIDQFIARLISDGTVDPDASIEDNVRALTGFADDVRSEALRYLELAESG
jgi:hypothetical protein